MLNLPSSKFINSGSFFCFSLASFFSSSKDKNMDTRLKVQNFSNPEL